jgi:DNA (cytosine-5)-methyltransferase 1
MRSIASPLPPLQPSRRRLREGRNAFRCEKKLAFRPSFPAETWQHFKKVTIRAIDMFSGGGGSSWGASKAGIKIVAALDRCGLAAKTYKTNFPNTKFFRGKIENRNLKKLKKQLGRIDLILASPECTSHSPARGNKPRSEASKDTAFEVVRFARAFQPRWIVIENVVSMRRWSRYGEFKKKLEKQGYHIREQILNSMYFRVPQSRRRLFLLCDRERLPRNIRPLSKSPISVRTLINFNGEYSYSPLYKKNRAKATIARARRALRALGKKKPFLLVYYGSDAAGGWQTLNRPLRTVTTVDRFALVKPNGERSRAMRMLQVPELQIAMGMLGMSIKHGSRRERIKLLGNAVCSPVMKSVIKSLTARDHCKFRKCQ